VGYGGPIGCIVDCGNGGPIGCIVDCGGYGGPIGCIVDLGIWWPYRMFCRLRDIVVL
jgi:hypothetical protein